MPHTIHIWDIYNADYKYHWQRINEFANRQRRSGRSKLIIAAAIHELLSSGECIITDHEGSPQTMSYYEQFTLTWFYEALYGLFEKKIRYEELKKLFPANLVMEDGYCISAYIRARNIDDFNYHTGYIAVRLEKIIDIEKENHSLTKSELKKYTDIKLSFWKRLKFLFFPDKTLNPE